MFPTHDDLDAIAVIKKRNMAQRRTKTIPSTHEQQQQQQHQQAMSYVRFHAGLAVLGYFIIVMVWLMWYYSNKTVPDRIAQSGFYEQVTSPSFKYALVASISTGSILLFKLVFECIEYVMREGITVIKWRNIISLSDERFMRLMVIFALIIPAMVNFFSPDNKNKIVLSDLMNLLRTLTIFLQTVLGMTATFDVTLWQRRGKAGFSLLYFFGGFVIYLVDVQYFQLSNDVLISSSSAAKSVSICRIVIAIGSGVAMLLYLMYHYSSIAIKYWKQQSLSLAEEIFVVYSLPVYIASVQYIIVLCSPGHTSYWSTSLSNMVTRELLVVVYLVIASLVPGTLIRRHTLAVQAQNIQAKEAIEAVLNSPALLPCTTSELDHLIKQSPDGPFAASLVRAAFACHLTCSTLQSIADDDTSMPLTTDLMHRSVDESVVHVPPPDTINRDHSSGGDGKDDEGDEEANNMGTPFEFRPCRVRDCVIRRDHISSIKSDSDGGGLMFVAGAGAVGFNDRNVLELLMTNRRQVLCSKVSSNPDPMISCLSITPPRGPSPDPCLSVDTEVRQRFMHMLGKSMQRREREHVPLVEADDHDVEANDATPLADDTASHITIAAIALVSNPVVLSSPRTPPQKNEEKEDL